MLERLIISNIALISRLDIELGTGMNVLTGETGAGKSIIIDSVNLVLGERASRDLIASGQQRARVEAVFSIDNDKRVNEKLTELGLRNDENELYLMREITVSGKSICRINGELVPLSALHSVADSLIDVHGQHSHQSLLAPKRHMDMVDEFDAEHIRPLRESVADIYRQYNEIEKKMNFGFISAAERERRMDILSFQIKEIAGANLSADEEKSITEELAILSNAEKIDAALQTVSELISGEHCALDELRRATDAMSRITDLSRDYFEMHNRLDGLYYELEDCAYELRNMRDSFEYSPERLNELENRLDYINSLKRKYGGSVAEVIEFMNSAQEELDELLSSDEIRASLDAELKRLAAEYASASEKLTLLRNESAKRLSDSVTEELSELGMVNARFTAVNSMSSGKLQPNGNDSIEFMLSANAGEPCRPLSKVASGGEISRIMLAIKTVCADADAVPTLIFDEIDSGISGVTAVTVGERMARIARSHQVICITHLPQIAAFADLHLLVEKRTRKNETHTSLRALDDCARRTELARIMGSVNADESAVKYADELITASEKYKLEIARE